MGCTDGQPQGIRRMDEVSDARIRQLCGVTKIDEGKLFFDDSAMWKEWKMTGLLRRSM